jgi:5-methylthioribose kinase
MGTGMENYRDLVPPSTSPAMREITPENAADYLRETGRAPADRPIAVRELGWGVSNLVLRVEVAGHDPFVLKQAREQLRTKMLWVSRLDRVWAEVAALWRLSVTLPAGAVPRVLWEDRDEFLFAMSCAPDEAVVWKGQLLEGHLDPQVARHAGDLLAAMHADPADPGDDRGPLADTTVFDQLRLDPFYRTVARVHPGLAGRLAELIEETLHPPERTFVHADFSPKNLLVHPCGGLTVVDFETAHVGDPAFDLGFFASHLLLKTLRAAPAHEPYLDLVDQFLGSYRDRAGADRYRARLRRAAVHAAACALARVDGKSPVDYLDEPRRQVVRRFATALLSEGPFGWGRLMEIVSRELVGMNPETDP